MDVICIDDIFHPESIRMIPNRPVKDKIYSIRDAFLITRGDIAVHLNEITNPPIPHSSGMMFEPSFNIKRFATLSGEPLSKEKVEQKVKIKI